MMTNPVVITDSNVSDWSQPEFWCQICPHLHISTAPVDVIDDAVSTQQKSATASAESASTSSSEVSRYRQEQLRTVGFVEIDDKLNESLIECLRQGIENLSQAGLPATYILLYDETWELGLASCSILRHATHPKHQFGYDVLAWCIEQSGFSPHRDRQPENDTNVMASFTQQGDPDFVTHWIALTDAMPSNSCLYVISANHDPGYHQGDGDHRNPLEVALPEKHAYQNIRAIPRKAGESVLFTHRILHWGSTRTQGPPRMAISFVSANPSYEAPYLLVPNGRKSKMDNNVDNENDGSIPVLFQKTRQAFSSRLLLVCAQLLIYYQRFELSIDTIQACYSYCKQHEHELEETYRRKVFLEYVHAMKEKQDDAADNNSDREEAVLEAMLDQEQELSDDYDELLSGNEEAMVHPENESNTDDDDDDDDDAQYGDATLFGKRGTCNDLKNHESKRAKHSL
jgi:hypothetical protein